MSIRFSVKPCPLPGFFGKKSADLSGKAADALAYAKLRRTVDDLEDEIMLQMCAIGELVYATHCGDPSDSDELQKILEYVDDLHDEIEGHEQQMMLLRGLRICPICGSEVSEGDVFCQECGQPLPVSPSDQS